MSGDSFTLTQGFHRTPFSSRPAFVVKMHELMPVERVANASQNESYRNLCLILEFPNNGHRLWWYSTAPMFAEMLRVANYDIHFQYKYLYIIPTLGVYPTNDRERWLSILTRYGTPFELSLNCGASLV